MRKIVLILCALLAAPSFAAEPGWSCRNTDAEITCWDGSCDVVTGEGFTPMSVTFRSGRLDVCAYTWCWSGSATVLEDDMLVYVQSRQLRDARNKDGDPGVFQLALNKKSRLAVLNGEGLAHPMHCEPWACSEDCDHPQ